jgi:transcriptional regulator with XRE-family HTH domain
MKGLHESLMKQPIRYCKTKLAKLATFLFFCGEWISLSYRHGSVPPGRPISLMASKIPIYLRTYRKRHGLTQDEVAFLLGCQNGANVSRFERLARQPNLESAIACEVVFGKTTHDLFPRAYAEVERSVAERARALVKRLQTGSPETPGLRQKLASLEAIIGRGALPRPVARYE